MFRIVSRSSLFALPLSLILAGLTTFMLYRTGDNDLHVADPRVIGNQHLILEFAATFVFSYLCQLMLFAAIGLLMKLFPSQ